MWKYGSHPMILVFHGLRVENHGILGQKELSDAIGHSPIHFIHCILCSSFYTLAIVTVYKIGFQNSKSHITAS